MLFTWLRKPCSHFNETSAQTRCYSIQYAICNLIGHSEKKGFIIEKDETDVDKSSNLIPITCLLWHTNKGYSLFIFLFPCVPEATGDPEPQMSLFLSLTAPAEGFRAASTWVMWMLQQNPVMWKLQQIPVGPAARARMLVGDSSSPGNMVLLARATAFVGDTSSLCNITGVSRPEHLRWGS